MKKKLKKIIPLILALSLLLGMMPAAALADDSTEVTASGTCGDNLTWELTSDGTLTISGTGEMEDYTSGRAPWHEDYADEINFVVINSGVTSIGSSAFDQCTGLTNIIIPDSITSIGDGAFTQCAGLTNIAIPDSVTSIGSSAFEECTGLISITIPNGVASISDSTFAFCDSLASITIPDSVTSIGERAFMGCNSLTSIIIPDSVASIGFQAFVSCSSLASIIIPDSVTSISGSTFRGCSSLTSITIPGSVTSIGSYAFWSCDSLTNIEIPDSVTIISEGVFYYCTSLTSIVIPDSVTSIGSRAFGYCTSLTDVYYAGSEDEWETISISYGNTYLTSATIHYNSTGSDTDGTCGEGLSWSFNSATGMLTISGEGAMDDWDAFTLEEVPWYDYLYQITSINIKDGVTTIGQCAFNDCENLEFVMLPSSLESIGAYAFNCYSKVFTDVYYAGSEETWLLFTDNISEIGNDALSNACIHYNSTGNTLTKESTFKYISSITGETVTASYTYDESWFYESSYVYQHALTQMSLRVSMAAFGAIDPNSDDYDANEAASNITALMDDLAFSNIDVEYVQPESSGTIGYVIGSKTIIDDNGEEYTLLMVAVRGGGYGEEWGDNFRIVSDSGIVEEDHYGFAAAAETVVSGISEYINTYGLDAADVKVWISGYSRAAATTNLAAAYLDDGAIPGLSAENIYAFCFECPKNTTNENASDELYNNIVNIVNPIDFVTKLVMTDWGYTRYGKTYYLPDSSGTDSEYTLYEASLLAVYQSIMIDQLGGDNLSAVGALYYAECLTYAEIGLSVQLDNLMGALASAMESPEKYYWDTITGSYGYTYQETLIETLASTLGDGGTCILGDVTGLVSLIGSILDNISFTEVLKVLDAFLNCGDYSDLAETLDLSNGTACYAHYPELCMAWLDIIDFEEDETSSGYRTAVVNCPVDVSVYNDEGDLVAQIIDGDVQYIEDGLYAYIDDDDQMVVILPCNNEYSVKLESTDSGTMTYTVTEYSWDEGTTRVVSYYDVAIEEGDVFYSAVENLQLTKNPAYALTTADGKNIEASVNQSGDEVATYSVSAVAVGNGSVYSGTRYVSGEYVKLTAVADDEYEFIGWYIDGELVSEDTEYRMLVDGDVEITGIFSTDESDEDSDQDENGGSDTDKDSDQDSDSSDSADSDDNSSDEDESFAPSDSDDDTKNNDGSDKSDDGDTDSSDDTLTEPPLDPLNPDTDDDETEDGDSEDEDIPAPLDSDGDTEEETEPETEEETEPEGESETEEETKESSDGDDSDGDAGSGDTEEDDSTGSEDDGSLTDPPLDLEDSGDDDSSDDKTTPAPLDPDDSTGDSDSDDGGTGSEDTSGEDADDQAADDDYDISGTETGSQDTGDDSSAGGTSQEDSSDGGTAQGSAGDAADDAEAGTETGSRNASSDEEETAADTAADSDTDSEASAEDTSADSEASAEDTAASSESAATGDSNSLLFWLAVGVLALALLVSAAARKRFNR